jgi:TrmH family RNA methyltransferase
MITSSQNSKIKLIRELSGRARDRRETGAFLAEGVRLVEEALAANWPFRFVLHTEDLTDRAKSLLIALHSKEIEVEAVSESVMKSIRRTETSQGILAILELASLPIPNLPNFLLIPDQIRDPGNLGALIRTAAAAGVDAILIPPETTDAFAPKVVRAGMGAHFRLPIHSLAWDQIKERVDPLSVYLADADGKSMHWDADFKSPLALIVGGEAEGASDSARKLATKTIRIPMPGKIESLNAAVAGSVLMFEVVRQRGHG